MLLWHTACHPQRLLQPRGKRLEALPAPNDTRVAPAAVSEAELIQPMRERQTGNADPEFVGYGEVRQGKPPRWMLLGKEDLAFRAVFGAPLAHAPLQRPQHRIAPTPRMTALQLLQHRHGHKRRRALEKWHDFAVPHFVQWVGSRTPASRLALRGQHRTPLNTPRAAHADSGLGRSRLLAIFAS